MGRSMDKVKTRIEDIKDGMETAAEKGAEDVAETEKMREYLDAVPEGTDDDILALKETVEQSSVSEAVSDMQSDVYGELESGKEIGSETQEEASELEEYSNEAAEAYGQVSETKFAGEASDAQSEAEDNAQEYGDLQEEVTDIIGEGEDEYVRNLEEIEG